jgi:hypothetical protein
MHYSLVGTENPELAYNQFEHESVNWHPLNLKGVSMGPRICARASSCLLKGAEGTSKFQPHENHETAE